jgi:hypothetical protein
VATWFDPYPGWGARASDGMAMESVSRRKDQYFQRQKDHQQDEAFFWENSITQFTLLMQDLRRVRVLFVLGM